ncbi:MFS transporter [Penicillium chermesinum]|uniref:MFS transporter n=1 Tax=Penicillium chermesinum TaxID=63820 RepID=A0A9W9TKH8_9EURO|nr:MFS transporter [Penicillium chermesinum]KAJ5226038.1 MFS transporter [Penicillium chermesinum]
METSQSIPFEKQPEVQGPSTIEEETEALEGYVVDTSRYADNAASLKTSSDGRYVLIPQPSDSSHDPLNWTDSKKRRIIATVAYISMLADYTGGTAIMTVLPQAVEWKLPQQTVQKAVVGNLFSIGACGFFVVAFASYFGRWPVIFAFQCIMVGTCVWCATATSFSSYLGSRIINGLFCSAGQGGGLMWVKDMFFFHEHPQVINYVEFSIVLSPYLGPLITSFIVYGVSWRWAFWVCTILSGVGLILVLFMDETLFNRKDIAVRRGSCLSRLIRARTTRRQPKSFTRCMMRPVVAITKVPVLVIMIYYFLNSAWVVGVNTTIGIWLSDIYGFSTKAIGYFYFFGIVGVMIGWFSGHFLHDAVGRYYIKRHAGRLDPEARLIIAYPATMIACISLIVLGFAFEKRWHYMVIAVFTSTQCIGVMIVTTAINAYLLDCYPEGSGEVGAWVAASRNWAGFMATYIQLEWVQSVGAARALGIQAAITVASLFLMMVLQVYGKRLRQWQGRMVFSKP